jgi:hypothetical protein
MDRTEIEALVAALFTNLATAAPLFIVWAIGIVLALSRWRRHPRVSQFAIIAFAVMIVATVITRIIYILLPVMMRNAYWAASEFGTIYTAIGIVSTLVETVASGLLLWAIFGWREQSKKENLFPPEPPSYGNEPREQGATSGFTQR